VVGIFGTVTGDVTRGVVFPVVAGGAVLAGLGALVTGGLVVRVYVGRGLYVLRYRGRGRLV
jgi:hypothetical protein